MIINLYSIFTLLIVLTAAFSYINIKFIKLPSTIGVMIISLACSLILLGVGKIYPEFLEKPSRLIESLDFETLLMRVMLSFLLVCRCNSY